MPQPLEKVLQAIDARHGESQARLMDFLKIPSVSTKPDNAKDVRDCATWLAEQIRGSGLETKIMPTAGHPVVVAKNQHQPGRPTVLFYGHYDVQPAEPLDLWTTPAFEPTIRDNAIYARGAADDKGQVWAHVEAVRVWQLAGGGVPVNITLLIEGEEEIGSINLESFVRQNREELKADVAVVSDTHQFARGIPAITYGLRGLAYMEVVITGPGHDLHSGIYGGSVPNPANILTELLATLHDADGRVTIEGFYDDVAKLTDEERAMWQKLPFDEKKFADDLKLSPSRLMGEKSFSTLERRWARPTCDINGLTSGYQGPGAKTIIPSQASAKVSMRLVPNQDAEKIVKGFEKTLRDRCPKSVKLEIHCHSYTGPVLVPIQSRAMQLAADAVEIGFGQRPTLMREGGSIPVVSLFKSVFNIDTLLVGFGLPDDRVHSPNEKFDLDALHAGTRTAAALYEKLAQLTGS